MANNVSPYVGGIDIVSRHCCTLGICNFTSITNDVTFSSPWMRVVENPSVGRVAGLSLVQCDCFLHLFFSHYHVIYSVRQKKYTLKFFAIFLATAWNFYMKFHAFITHS